MKSRFSIAVMLIFGALAMVFAQAKTDAAADFAQRMAESQTQIQTAIQSLELQLASAGADDQEKIQQQIISLKRDGEIQRLTILLEQANLTGDMSRAQEISRALSFYQNPPQVQTLPVQEKNPADYPGSDPKVAPVSK
jgi:hypothetical protein